MAARRSRVGGIEWFLKSTSCLRASRPLRRLDCIFAIRWKPARAAGKSNWKTRTAIRSSCSSQPGSRKRPGLKPRQFRIGAAPAAWQGKAGRSAAIKHRVCLTARPLQHANLAVLEGELQTAHQLIVLGEVGEGKRAEAEVVSDARRMVERQLLEDLADFGALLFIVVRVRRISFWR